VSFYKFFCDMFLKIVKIVWPQISQPALQKELEKEKEERISLRTD
jgi:hypothetical protein